MAHESENVNRLAVHSLDVASLGELPAPNPNVAELWLFTLPFGRTIADADRSASWFAFLRRFAELLNPQSVVAVITSAQDAAETLPRLGATLKFQLWISVKLAAPMATDTRHLPEHHAALLILSKYHTSLRHTKTRIAYTYCPACDKTTKDYGGKKHTYHQYGTLLSDVWRDIAWQPDSPPNEIVTRLADLFGLEPYRSLRAVSLVRAADHQPAARPRRRSSPRSSEGPALESQLRLGDCLEELHRLPDNSVDFCFADPPYNLSKRYDRWDDSLDSVEYFAWCDRWLDELGRVLKSGRSCAVLNIPQWATRHFAHLQRRLTFQNWIAWEGLSLPVRMIMPAHYAILCFSKGKSRPIPGRVHETVHTLKEFYCLRASCVRQRGARGIQDQEPVSDLWWDIHRLKHNSRRVDHPCQLPPALMQRLIALFTEPGEIVLDPFDGAGTTSLSAALLGRRYYGIELSETYHRLALERHAILERGGDPFAKVNGVPQAKNSRVRRVGQVEYAVPKKTLQLEVRRVARELGHLPSREELARHGRYPIRYYDEYFISWGEVCAAARTTGMSETRSLPASGPSSDQPMLFDEPM
jgi:site-specific DNA-methyltransferase (adenine-specific)